PVPGISVTFTPATGSGSVSPSTTVKTDASGVSTLTSWTLGTIAGPQTLTVSAPSIADVTIHATAKAGSAAKLAITTQPSAAATSGLPFARQPVIQIEDQFGNATGGSSITVTTAPSAGALVGTASVFANSTSGVATFTDLGVTG